MKHRHPASVFDKRELAYHQPDGDEAQSDEGIETLSWHGSVLSEGPMKIRPWEKRTIIHALRGSTPAGAEMKKKEPAVSRYLIVKVTANRE